MVERAQTFTSPEAQLTGINPSCEYSPSRVGDQTPNNYWQRITGKRNFSNPGALQMLNDGMTIVDTPILLADDKRERGSEIHDWLRARVKDAKDVLKDKPLVHEVSNDAQEVMNDLKAILHDPNRNKGEFSWAIGAKDSKLYGSNASFTPTEGKSIDGSEIHGSANLAGMELAGYRITTVIHTHPDEKDMGTNNFSTWDKAQADQLQGMYGGNVKSYLLTPDNHLLIYAPKDSKEHPGGEEIGFFLKNGHFVCTNERYKEFKSVQ
jgi:hypothetical protein